jgi:hypothetical protein
MSILVLIVKFHVKEDSKFKDKYVDSTSLETPTTPPPKLYIVCPEYN